MEDREFGKVEELFQKADFSTESDFKERLWKRLSARFGSYGLTVREIEDDDLENIAAARAGFEIYLNKKEGF